MKKQLVLFILLLCCFSCASQKKEIITKSTIKLEGRDTNIRDLIEIDGYYYMKEYPDSNCRIFFEDGVWVQFSFNSDVSEDKIKANLFKSVYEGRDKKISWGFRWGAYRIQNDTIIVNCYSKWEFGRWSFSEDRYKVVDRETVRRISYRGLLKADESSNKIYGTKLNQTFHFTSADSIPSSDNWLKQEKWIWRNESDWKDYMQKVEQKKKQFKRK